jgi:hypothetical protein
MKAALLLLLAAAPTAATAEPGPKLDMLAFFAGRTHSDNIMKVALHKPSKLVVDSVGGKGDRGDFVLIDTVHEEGKPVRTRKWVMRPIGPDHFTGSLSDAAGPVDVVISGDTATIRYVMKDGHLAIVQQLKLQPGGKTLANHTTAKKFGLKFGSIDGEVRKLD